MVDNVTTFARPSAPQKRACANGRSAEMHSTTALSRPLASWLKWRTEVAQVGVSTLGKIFRIFRLPAKSVSETFLRSLATSENAGAGQPAAGKERATGMGLPV